MADLQNSYPWMPADCLARRFEMLERRGDVVRAYRELVNELRESMLADIRAERKRSALIHFRTFADYCLRCLFVAYAASEDELDRKSSPKNLIGVAERVITHWEMPVPPAAVKDLARLHAELSQATHGTPGAVKKVEKWAPKWIPDIEKACDLLVELVGEADFRLNGHRG